MKNVVIEDKHTTTGVSTKLHFMTVEGQQSQASKTPVPVM